MTETEWQTAVEPHAMLEFLRTRGNVSPRKLRLFAVACSRRVWHLIDPLGHTAIEVAERFADYTLLDSAAPPAAGVPPLAMAEDALERLVRDKRAFLRGSRLFVEAAGVTEERAQKAGPGNNRYRLVCRWEFENVTCGRL